ncbi:MAG: phage major capsid protein [Dehalococcoidia bacterium]|nr:MAG: phage major capsid protein [Dehalococcoidia bacterium]
MGTTLPQYAKLSNDILKQGVIETIIKESPLMALLPWVEINGNALTYNRELTLPNAEWHAVNDDWTTSPAVTFTQKTATLAILGQNADVDNYFRQTRSNINDIETAIIELTAKSIKNELEDKLLYGNNTTDPNQFDGLIAQIATGSASDQVIAAGASGGTAITLEMIDQLIDAVKGGKPDLLLMSRRSRRKISALARAAGNNLEHDSAQFGFRVEYYGGTPIQVSDFIKDTHTVAGSVETALSGAASSTIYAISLGEDGVCGLTGPGGMQIIKMGDMETKDATRTRIKMYASLALFSNVKAAALIGCA